MEAPVAKSHWLQYQKADNTFPLVGVNGGINKLGAGTAARGFVCLPVFKNSDRNHSGSCGTSKRFKLVAVALLTRSFGVAPKNQCYWQRCC